MSVDPRKCPCCVHCSPLPAIPTSPVSHAFQTPRSAISPAEGIVIRQALNCARATDSTLSVRIAHLERALEEARAVRQANAKFISSHSALLSSILRIPVEVLSEIFLMVKETQQTEYSDSTFMSGTLTTCPMSLSLVCSEWRAIAIGQSSLWTDIQFNINCDGVCPSHIRLLSTFLIRGRDQPLTLSIALDGEIETEDMGRVWSPSEEAMKGTENILSLLAHHGERWKQIELSIPAELYERITLPFSTPQLRKLSILAPEPDEFSLATPLFPHAPRLQHVVFHFLGFRTREQLTHSLPWANLCRLDMPNAQDAQDVLKIVQLSTNLKTLRLDSTSVLEAQTMICHESLEHLELTSELALPMLACFTFPNLIKLTMHDSIEGPTLGEFFSRSPKIRELHLLYYCSFLLKDVLPVLPSLERLQTCLVWRAPYLQALTEDLLAIASLQSLNILPRLLSVEISLASFLRPLPNDMTYGGLVYAVRKAAQSLSSRPIESFQVKIRHHPELELVEEAFLNLRELEIPGLTIHVE